MLNYTKVFSHIRTLSKNGSAQSIDDIMRYLNDQSDLPTTRAVDLYLGEIVTEEGIRRIEYYLFNGSLIQRNYCTLFFARRNDWHLVNKAYEEGLIDAVQAYSR